MQLEEIIFSSEYFEKMKGYFHPRLHRFIDNYSGANDDLILLPPYHGCGLKNRNGTKKLIDYSIGKQCLFPVWSNGKEIRDSCYRPFTRYIYFNGKDRVLLKAKVILFLTILLINTTICRTLQIKITLKDFLK